MKNRKEIPEDELFVYPMRIQGKIVTEDTIIPTVTCERMF